MKQLDLFYPVISDAEVEGFNVKVEQFSDPPLTKEDTALRAHINEVLDQLLVVSKRPECMARLHEIERMMVRDVLAESRHLRCFGCLRWLTGLLTKATAGSTSPTTPPLFGEDHED